MKSTLPLEQSKAERRRRFAGFACAYFVLWLALWYSSGVLEQISGISLWFLPAGLRYACILLLGWPGLLLELTTILLLLLLQLILSNGMGAAPSSYPATSLLYNLFAYAGSYALILLPLRQVMRRMMRGSFDFTKPLHSFFFVASALVVAALSAAAGTFYMSFTGFIGSAPWNIAFANWLLGDFIGIISLVPLLLVQVWPRVEAYLRAGAAVGSRSGAVERPGVRKHSNLHVVSIVAGALSIVIYIAHELTAVDNFPIVALSLLAPLAVVIMRYSLRGAVLAVALFDAGMVGAITLLQQGANAFQYQLVMIAIVLVGLWLGGAIEGRNRIMRQYQDFAGVANDLLWEIDAEGRLLTLNGRMARFVARLLGRPWQDLLAGASAAQIATLERHLSEHRPFLRLDMELRRGSSGPRWIQLNGLPVRSDAGDAIGFRGTARNVTRAYRARDLLRNYNQALRAEVEQRTRELLRSHEELAVKERHLSLMFAAAPVGVLELDDAGRCTYLNAHAAILSGWSGDDPGNRGLLGLVQAQDREQVQAAWVAQHEQQEVRQLDFRMARTGIWCGAYWSRLPPTESSAARTIVVFSDVSARYRQEELLWKQAHHDPLTGLPNRALFWDRCGQALSLAKRQGTIAALLWIDLDDFKPVNDRLGHAAGDMLLHQVAQRMKSRLRESDTLARMGGDEFAVVLPDVKNLEHAMAVATELNASLGAEFHLSQGTATVSCSVGVALYPQHADDFHALAQCADAALYGAKNRHKGSIGVWDPHR